MSEMKQVIVMRRDLKMSRGKEISQAGHAVLGARDDAMDRWGEIGPDMIAPWNENGWTKVTCKVFSEEELLALVEQAELANIGHYLVRDHGKTEVEPDTPTCLAIGPNFSRHIDKITGELALY
jgi:PTH2 family peptidyl-tRNA hydrolase